MLDFRKLTAAAAVATLALGLAACSSSDDPPPPEPDPMPMPEPEPDPAEEQMNLIDDALGSLSTALAGLDADDPTVMQMGAVDAAISLLQNALTGAVDLSPNDTAAARGALSSAVMTVATARQTYSDAMDLAGKRTMQMEDISDAQAELSDALDALMADDPASITAVNDAIDDLQTAVNAAVNLTDAEKMSAMSDLMGAEVSAANAELDMYKAAAMMDGASDEALLAAYKGKLMSATRLVAALEATDGSAADIAAANQVIGSATTMIATLEEKIQMAADARDNEQRLANNAVSMKVAEAIIAHTVAGNPGSEFVTPATAPAPPGTNFGVKRTSGDAMVSLTQTATAAREKPYAESAAPSVMDFMGTQFSNTRMSGKRPVTEMAAVYTDIEMSGDTAWLDYFGTTDAAAATGIVTLANRTGTTAVTTERVSAGVLPAAPSGSDASNTRTIAAATKTTETRIPGSFYGVSGVYTCAASTACTVARDRAGVLTFVGLTFAPTVSGTDILTGDDATVMAKYVDPDMDYTYFGYWMQSTTLRDGTKEHDIETFHGGMGLLSGETAGDMTTGTIETVVGTAKYYGSAAGVYAKKDGAGDSLVITDGKFTADAMLMARFGGDAIAVADQFEVEGTISDFMDGSTDLGFADLALNAADILKAYDTTNTVRTGSFSGETDGGGTSGNWMGQFHGNANPGNDNEAGEAVDLTNDFPSDVSGEFNGHFANGHVVGAFGAETDR